MYGDKSAVYRIPSKHGSFDVSADEEFCFMHIMVDFFTVVEYILFSILMLTDISLYCFNILRWIRCIASANVWVPGVSGMYPHIPCCNHDVPFSDTVFPSVVYLILPLSSAAHFILGDTQSRMNVCTSLVDMGKCAKLTIYNGKLKSVKSHNYK